MSTQNSKAEIVSPGLLKADIEDGEKFREANMVSAEGAGFEVNNPMPDVEDFGSNDQFPYNMEGESLW